MRRIDQCVRVQPPLGLDAALPVDTKSSAAATKSEDLATIARSETPSTETASISSVDRYRPTPHRKVLSVAAPALVPSRSARMQFKLEAYRMSIKLQVARRLERFNSDNDFRLQMLMQHADRHSYVESVVRHRHLSRVLVFVLNHA